MQAKIPPELLNYYTDLHQELGIGGFGKVILACHNDTGIKVAIKVIFKECLKDQEYRIRDEINILKKLHHCNICKLFQVYEDIKNVYMIMEYLPGGELYDQIVINHQLSEKEARRIFRQVLSAVGYMHSQGVAHRDLKPENVLLDEMKNIRLIDFGLSANPKGGLIDPLETLCGSIAYAAPELLSGDKYYGNEADVWSLGVLLFTLLCGYLPFQHASNIKTVLENIKKGICIFSQKISKEAKNFVSRMLEPDPLKRDSVWKLSEHPWINQGYGSAVGWGVLSEKKVIFPNWVSYLSVRYKTDPEEIISMLEHENLNEITSHYDYIFIRNSYNCIIFSDSLCFKNVPMPESLYMHEDIRRSFEAIRTNIEHINQRIDSFDYPTNPIGVLDKINSSEQNVSANKFKRKMKPISAGTSKKIMNTVTKHNINNNDKENGYSSQVSSKNNIMGRIAEFFTPKRSFIRSGPRLLKPAGNIISVSSCNETLLQNSFDTILLELKKSLYLSSVKLENYMYKCEKIDSKGHKMVFTLEICKIESNSSIEAGVLSKRMRGDSWEYKKVVEHIMNTVISFVNTSN